MSVNPSINGNCDPRFRRVREAFGENFHAGKEIGAAVAITIDGRSVVDLWGGHADPQHTREWERDTVVNVYSTTKGITATCVHRLIDQRVLDLDQKVSHYWPEFAKRGKGDITVRYLLSHRAGLPAVSSPLPPEAIFDWSTMVNALVEQEPWWVPGTKHGYHARTFGWLLGEVVRRATGKSIRTYFREQIAGPLGLDFDIGLGLNQQDRVAFITALPLPPPDADPNLIKVAQEKPTSVTAMTFLNPPAMFIPDLANTPEWRRAELPSSNGHGTARALARLYGALACGGSADGVRVLSKEGIERARTEQSRGTDEVLLTETRFGLGFMMPVPRLPMGPNDRAFGHVGMGGSLGFADPEASVGFGYVMNRTGPEILGDERHIALIQAMYASL